MIKATSAEKVFNYMFGEGNWQKFPVIELAVRNETDKPNIFNDELHVFNTKTGKHLDFVWNTDPSRYHVGTRDIAKLRPGVHFYRLSYHHINNNAKRYVALRPRTSNETLPVTRKKENGEVYFDYGVAINQHAGGSISTGSEGCQTARAQDFPEFITFIGEALGVKVPLGKIRKADPKFVKGIGNIPYVLLTQKQFKYIMELPENRFDSTGDLTYQLQNFVNIPKIERVLPEESKVVPQGEKAALQELEESEQSYIESGAGGISDEFEEQSPDESPDKKTAAPDDSNAKIAIEKPEPQNFLEKMRAKISALTGGNIGLQALRDWAEQAQFLGLSVKFWFWVSLIAITATVIYLISEFYKHRSDTKRDLDLTNKLIEANSTDSNIVKLIGKDESDDYKKNGYRIITR